MRLYLFSLFSSLVLCSLYECVSSTFTSTCKGPLYECLNDPSCSYQFNINSRHIKLEQRSTQFPPLYFSNPLARKVYECIKKACKLPQIDQQYPRRLPLEHCMFEVYDVCGGKDMEEIYKNFLANNATEEVECYKRYCGAK